MSEVQETPPEGHPQDSIISIVDFFKALRELRELTNTALLEWVSKRQHTILQLQQLSESLHKHYRNATIATATGAGVATASFGLILGGFIASFFTLGAGLIVSAVGAGVGAAGGLTMTGSKLAEYILSQLEMKEVQETLDEDREATAALRNRFEGVDLFFARNSAFICRNLRDPRLTEGFGIEGIPEMFPGFKLDALKDEQDQDTRDTAACLLRTLGAGFTVPASAATASVNAGRAVFNTLSVAARAAHIAGFAASAALLPIDIYFLVKSSVELHKGSTSEIVTKIQKDLAELTCPSEEEVPELVPQYIKDKFLEILRDHAQQPESSVKTESRRERNDVVKSATAEPQ